MADEALEKLKDVTRFRLPRYVAYGVDFNDIERILDRIGGTADWLTEWLAEADDRVAEAEAALARGRTLSAGELLVRAGLLCHFGALPFKEDKAQRDRAMARKVALFTRALPMLDPPGERVEFGWRDYRFPGHLRIPRSMNPPPVVVIVPGTGSTKEEFFLLEGEFLRRGVATLSLDGPGQGEGAADGPVPYDFEGPLGAVIDALEERDDVDSGRVGLFGRSMGGYLTGRAAAFDSRVRAVSASGGVFDLVQTWEFCKPHTHGSFREMLQVATLEEAREKAVDFTLRGVAERISCPLFLVHGDRDPTAPLAGAEEYHRIAGSKDKELAVIAGGNHVVDNKPYLYRPMVADWMAETLGRN